MFALATIPCMHPVVENIEEEIRNNGDVWHMRSIRKKLSSVILLPRAADAALLMIVSAFALMVFGQMIPLPRLVGCVFVGIAITQSILIPVAYKVKKVYINGTLIPI